MLVGSEGRRAEWPSQGGGEGKEGRGETEREIYYEKGTCWSWKCRQGVIFNGEELERARVKTSVLSRHPWWRLPWRCGSGSGQGICWLKFISTASFTVVLVCLIGFEVIHGLPGSSDLPLLLPWPQTCLWSLVGSALIPTPSKSLLFKSLGHGGRSGILQMRSAFRHVVLFKMTLWNAHYFPHFRNKGVKDQEVWLSSRI